MRENGSNVAVARQFVDSKAALRSKKQKKPLLKGLPLGEKLLYLFSVVFCVLLAFAVLSQLATINELNVAISRTESKIQQTKRVNDKLEMDKRKLESVDRIREYAESKGMKLKSPKILPSIQP
jgi:cell division protein FtsL